MKIVQISDIHLGAPGEEINGCHPSERLLSCFEDIVSWHSDAEFCVITGDLTEFAEPVAYEFLKSTLKDFPLPCYLMLGNHDDRTVFQSVFDDYFELLSSDRTFTEKNMGDVLQHIERDERAVQMWLLFSKKRKTV